MKNNVHEEIRYWESVQADYAARDMDEQAQKVYEQHLSGLYAQVREEEKED